MNYRLKFKTTYLEKPIPFLVDAKDKWLFILFINLYVAFFLLIFQPFGVNNYDPTHKIRLSLLIGISTFTGINILVMVLYEFGLNPILWKVSNRKTLGLRLVFLWLILSTCTFYIYNWMGDFHDWLWSSYAGFIRDIGLMLVIPTIGIILYFNQREVKKEVTYLKRQPIQVAKMENMISLVAENGKDKLLLDSTLLILLEAQDNYVAIFHLEHQHLKKTLFRSSLKKLEEQLEASQIIRCHRSYLINPDYIQKAQGNAHQLQLSIHHFPDTVPVSRTYIPHILGLLDIRPI
ncbi:MAG: LytTR family DNA-binding domain-containing protein [Saprospiraceae bacterium]